MGEIEAMARVARSLEDTGRHIGSPKPYEELQEEFRARMEKQQQGEAGSAMTEMEMARIEEILLGREAAERFLAASRRQGLRGR
jgi:fido (protein-threonine AMPylation protein)